MGNLLTENKNQEDLDPGKAEIIPMVYKIVPLPDLHPRLAPVSDVRHVLPKALECLKKRNIL